MGFKILVSIFTVALIALYMGAIAVKLKDPALFIVMLVGVVMVIVDLWQSLKEED
jgi:TctA family transporter